MRILVTGAAGFIGFHLCRRLLELNFQVSGLDNMNTYYDVNLKQARLDILKQYSNFDFVLGDLADQDFMQQVFTNSYNYVFNMAAQAGVRYSLENPAAYIQSNMVGFGNLLEGCRHTKVNHLIYASSSSVYGLNTNMPFSVHHNVDHPVSLYAASKKSNELMAHSYSHLYNLPCTGLRFFTVYGPWGRPDMALFLFTKNILENKAINVFNHGDMQRDFTYIDDIIESMVRLMPIIPKPDLNWDGQKPNPASSPAPWRIYNIGNHNPVKLNDFISALEKALGKKAIRNNQPMQAGDVYATWADVADLIELTGFTPCTPLDKGIAEFIKWYNAYYKI